MLVEFSVQNFLSFKEQATLSLVAAPDRSARANPECVTRSAQGTKLNLLRSAAIFGANASGKSNLLKALGFMRSFVLNSSTEGPKNRKTGVVPFKLDAGCLERPSTFEVVFLAEGVRYVYGFSADANQVREEWLSSYPHGSERVLFKRPHPDRGNVGDIYFGPHWGGEAKKLAQLTRDNALFVSVAAQFNHAVAQLVCEWFERKLKSASWFPSDGEELRFTVTAAERFPELRGWFRSFLCRADLDISEFKIKPVPIAESPPWKTLREIVRKDLLAQFPEDYVTYNVTMLHGGRDEAGRSAQIPLGLEEESDGTQKMFALAGPWEHVLGNGCVLFVDELDARLHPLLSKWLVSFFHANETNPHEAQLIFASHDENLMDPHVFRRDQIWFTEKRRDGASTLYSLWDYKKTPRAQENLRKGYLAGRYGGIPIIHGISK